MKAEVKLETLAEAFETAARFDLLSTCQTHERKLERLREAAIEEGNEPIAHQLAATLKALAEARETVARFRPWRYPGSSNRES